MALLEVAAGTGGPAHVGHLLPLLSAMGCEPHRQPLSGLALAHAGSEPQRCHQTSVCSRCPCPGPGWVSL